MALLSGGGTLKDNSAATTVRLGTVRIATDAEAAAGSNVDAMVTPDQLQRAVDSGVGSIAGAFVYRGLFDPVGRVPDISGGVKGDFYRVSRSGNFFGKEMNEGDDIFLIADMGGVIDVSKIFLIDNTESIAVVDDLQDVTLGTLDAGDVLRWDGSKFTDHALTVADIDGAVSQTLFDNTVDALETTDTSLQTQINDAVTDIADNLAEINRIETSVGLNTDGTFTPFIGSGTLQNANYIGGITNFRGIVDKLDNELGRVEYLVAQGVIDLQAELNLSQASLGLMASGSFSSFSGTNFMDSATSFRSADLKLDAAIKAEETARIAAVSAANSARASADSTLQTNINTEANTRATADSTLQTNINNEAAARSTGDSNLQTELNKVEASIGLDANGDLVAFTTTGVVAGQSTYLAAVNALSEEIVTVRDLVAGGIDNLQEELDNTQASLGGLTAAGTLIAFTNTNYLNGAASFRAADLELDVAIKVNANAIAALQDKDDELDTKDAELQAELDNTQASLGLTAGGTLTPFTLTGVVAGKTTHLAAIDALSTELVEVRGLVVGGVDNLNLDLTGSADPESFTGFAGTYVSAQTNFLSAIEALNDAIVAEKDASNLRMDGIDSTIEALDLALDAESQTRLTGDETLSGLITDLSDKFGEKPAHVVYVSGEYGNNSYNGSLYEPKASIAAALFSLPNDGSLAQVFVMPGVYSEDITLARTNTVLSGISPTGRVGHTSIINGGINIAPSFSAGGLFNNQISIENFLINKTGANPCINLGGTFLYICNVRNCQLFTDNANAGSLVKNTTTLQARLQFTNCSITSTATGDNHCVELTAGSLYIDGCEVYRTNGSSSSRAIKLSGTATCPRITSLLCTVSNCAYAVESSVAITMGNSIIGNSTANSSGIYMSAGICTALYTTFDVAVGTGHVIDGAVGSVYVYAYNTYINDVTLGANILKVALAGSLPAGLSQVAYSGFAEDVVVAHTAQNFTAAAQDSESFFVGIDNKFEDIDTAIAAAGKVETVNSVAPAEGSKDVLIDASNIAATITPSNYTALSSDAISTHLSAIDGELGDLATAIAAAGKVETVNGVAPVEGSKDVLIDASDIIVPASFNEGYIVADTLQSITAHFIAIDDALTTRISSINGISPSTISTAITLTAGMIPHAGSFQEFTPSGTSILDALNAIDTAFSGIASKSFITQTLFVTNADELDLEPGIHYIMSTAFGSVKTLNVPSLPADVSNGDFIKITNWGEGVLRLTETSGVAYLLDGDTIEGGLSTGSVDIVSRASVDLFGFEYPQVGYDVVWGIYFNSSVEFNTDGVQDGSIFKYNSTSRKMEVSPALSDVAYDGLASSIEAVHSPTYYTASTFVDSHLGGIDTRLGQLNFASNIVSAVDPSNYVNASSFVDGHLAGIDAKLAAVASAAGTIGLVQVSNGSGGLISRNWSIDDNSHLLPVTDGLLDLGGASNILRDVYTAEVQLGATDPKTLAKDASNNLLWNTKLVKVAGAALYDGVQVITINGSQKTLNLGNVIYASGNGTETWNLPAASSAGAAVILNFAKDSTGSVTLAASSIEGSTTYPLQARGNQALVVWNGTTYKVYESFQLRNSGGLQDLTEITSSTTLTKANTDLFSTASSDITVTLPLRSSMFLGEKIRITRSFSDGNITVNPNAADAGATAFKTPKGNATNYSLRNRGDVVIFVAGASSWLVLDSSLNTTVQLYSSSPVQVLQSNTVSRLAFAGNAVVNLPKTSNCKDGDVIVLYPHGDKSVTINLNAADAGVSSIRQGSTVHGNSVTLTAINARNITARYDESNDQFIVESPFGSAAQYDAGTSANQLLLIDGNGKLPAIDGSQLTGIVTGTGRFGYQKNTASFTALVGYHHSLDTTSGSIVATLPALSALNDGDFIRIKFTTKSGTNNVSIVTSGADTIEKLASINLTAQGEFLELVADTTGTNWEIVG